MGTMECAYLAEGWPWMDCVRAYREYYEREYEEVAIKLEMPETA